MDTLPESLLLEILSRLDDLADVAHCRVASKAFDSVFHGLRSIHLPCTMEWHGRMKWDSRIQPIKEVFVDLVSKLKTVESVCIGHENPFHASPLDRKSNDFYFTDGDFAKEWLPWVSDSLKSLSIFDHGSPHQSNVLPLISAYCHNLVNLNLKFAWLSMENLKPMLLLTSLTLEAVLLEDENLEVLNKCFPNLQVLNMLRVSGLKNPKIHLLKLKECDWDLRAVSASSLTLITPNLITLKVDCYKLDAYHVEAPMLTHFDLNIVFFESAHMFTFKRFESLKTLFVDSLYMDTLLSKFLITKSLEKLTLESGCCGPVDTGDSKLSLAKVFKVFPSVRSLSISSLVWQVLEARSVVRTQNVGRFWMGGKD